MLKRYNTGLEWRDRRMKRSKLLEKYLLKINYDSRPLGIPQAKQLFLEFMSDYLNYKIGIDEIADLCEEIWIEIKDNKKILNTRIEMLYSKAIDLSWQLRNDPNSVGEVIEELINKYKLLKDGKAI